jgi:hypothetical protein
VLLPEFAFYSISLVIKKRTPFFCILCTRSRFVEFISDNVLPAFSWLRDLVTVFVPKFIISGMRGNSVDRITAPVEMGATRLPRN